MEFNMLEKTELFIENIRLNHVNLDRLANSVAVVLKLDPRDVAVIDVRNGTIAIDILRATITLEQILGKKDAILHALNSINGITVTEKTVIHSEGILGMVNLNENMKPELQKGIAQIGRQIDNAVQSRAIVFPTGDEIIKGDIEDTNTGFLITLLSGLDYRVSEGKVLADSLTGVIGALRNAADTGYGLVITTGGVGAEDKDHLVEAIATLDSEAAMPYIVHYTQGHGRHKKDGVKIAVGNLDGTMLIALPGPHDEIKLAAPILAKGLTEHWDKITLAEKLAAVLRTKLIH